MKLQHRQFLLWGALTLTIAASVYVSKDEDKNALKPEIIDTIPTQISSSRLAQTAGAKPEVPDVIIAPREVATHIKDAFSTRDWRYIPPPPPSALPGHPLPSIAPIIPFRYIGHLQDGKDTMYFISHVGNVYSVRLNDVINGVWKLVQIKGNFLVFKYIPLNTEQMLPMGGQK